ncbi:hypothetical protein [Haliea sp. E1-2-M8]|uniref:hypothetical protein n=1 Tax=Haliea sp. E1-2-M8 TaxID=3064706 RepID=UPI00351C7DCA
MKGYRYDFNSNQYVDSRGRPVDAARLERAEGTGGARAARAGQATLRRGIFLQSLMESESGARPGILEKVFTRSDSLIRDGGLNRVFSSAATLSGSNPSDASRRGLRARALIAGHWDGDHAASGQAARRETRNTELITKKAPRLSRERPGARSPQTLTSSVLGTI